MTDFQLALNEPPSRVYSISCSFLPLSYPFISELYLGLAIVRQRLEEFRGFFVFSQVTLDHGHIVCGLWLELIKKKRELEK